MEERQCVQNAFSAKALRPLLKETIQTVSRYALTNQEEFLARLQREMLAEQPEQTKQLKKGIAAKNKRVAELASPLDKEQRMALKAERTQLEAEREALLPKLEEVKTELAELNRIRYWTRKVIPDALPHVLDGRVSVEDAMETAVNRKELEQVEDEATQTVLRELEESKSLQSERKQTDKLI